MGSPHKETSPMTFISAIDIARAKGCILMDNLGFPCIPLEFSLNPRKAPKSHKFRGHNQ